MTKRKRHPAAPPVSTVPELQKLERLARERISEIKQSDPERGTQVSLSVTTLASDVEKHVRRSTKILRSARRGHEVVYGTKAERAAGWERIRQEYVRLREAHPDWMEKELEDEIVKICGVSKRTVERHKK